LLISMVKSYEFCLLICLLSSCTNMSRMDKMMAGMDAPNPLILQVSVGLLRFRTHMLRQAIQDMDITSSSFPQYSEITM